MACDKWTDDGWKERCGYVNPIQTWGGGGLWRPYQTLNLNNFKAVKAMTTKFSYFS